jgi:hypothetical protein
MASRILRTVTATLLLVCLPALAAADVAELVNRVPPHTNAIVAVDLAHLTARPGAAAPGGAAAPATGPAARRSPVPLPRVAGLQCIVLAAHVNPKTADPAWEVALMQVGQKPSMQAIATGSGGYVDTVAGKAAAWSGNGVLCIALDDRVLASVYPGDRQFAARWVERLSSSASAAAPATGGASEYLRAAAAHVKAGTPIVIAVDLKDTLGEAGVRREFQADRPQWAANLRGDDKAIAAVLAGIKGVTVRIGTVGPEGAAGTMTVDFAQDAAPLADAAQDMVLGAMAGQGLNVPDLAGWKFAATGRAVTGQGRLTPGGFEQMVSFLSMPGVSTTDQGSDARPAAAQVTAARAPAEDPKQAKAQASRHYFKTVGSILDTFQGGASLSDGAAWLTRNANRIDQLPSDNVDADLLVWGAGVSSKLREAASIMSAGQQRVRARTSGVSVAAAYAADDDNPDPQRAAQARADMENSKRQRAQAGAAERAAVTQEASKPLREAMDSRGKIRATMVERYGSGF